MARFMLQYELLTGQKIEKINLLDAELELQPNFYSQLQSEQLFEKLFQAIDWQTETIRIAGVERLVPRLTAWYGDPQAHYRYSGLDHPPSPWSQQLKMIKEKVEQQTGYLFNSALCNLYRDGKDSVAWHSDDEPELGLQPIIASLSLGASRTFELKHKNKQLQLRHTISLTSGSLLIMKGATQSHWQHQVAKQKGLQQARINITFRNINHNC